MRLVLSIGAALTYVCIASPEASVGPGTLVPLNGRPMSAARDAAPRLSLVRGTPGIVELSVAVPAMRCTKFSARTGMFTRVTLDGCGPSHIIGQPALPVVRTLLVAPCGASVNVHVRSTPAVHAAGALALAGPVMPLQAPVLKMPGAADAAPFIQDAAAYAADTWFPRDQVRVSEAGVLAGRRLVLVEYAPVRYNPGLRAYALANAATIDVRFSGGTAATMPLSPREDALLASLAINHLASYADPPSGRLLVVTHAPFAASLAPFVAAKTSSGWSVILTNANAVGSAATNIRSFIHTMYTNIATRPDMVLLVGDVAQVPCFIGVSADAPPTDLYYGCMDGDDDWQPEFPVGRLSASSIAHVDAIVNKTVAYQTGSSGDWGGRACFMASADQYAITEGTHNWVISTYMTPLGYISDKFYCHTYNATRAQVSNAFNAGRALGIYSGHGNQTSWADGPVFGQADVLGLMNTAKYPFVCSFACLTGAMELDECFAETWLRAPSAAAVNVWASSVTSFWDEDDILERRLFSALYDHDAGSFGTATMLAKQLYLAYYGATATTRRYFEQYNLFGDPTALLVAPYLTITTKSPLPVAFTGELYRSSLAAAGGIQPYTNWLVASGSLPDGLLLVPTNGVIEGIPLAVTSTTFSVLLADDAGSICSGTYALSTIARLAFKPGIAWPSPTNLPDALVDTPYMLPMDALGGTPPYLWSLLPQDEWYAETITHMRPKAKIIAQNWKADDETWQVTLPHPFPFYGQNRTSLWVSSNGFIDFGSDSPDPYNSPTSLAAHTRIAPLWLDLTTVRGNIFLYSHPTSTFTCVRWKAKVYTTGKAVDFSLFLHTNGTIKFAYGTKLTVPSPTIGMSKGDMTHYTLSRLDGTGTVPKSTVSSFSYDIVNAFNLSISNNNVLVGRPDDMGSASLGLVVGDAGILHQSVTSTVMLTVVPEPAALAAFVAILAASRFRKVAAAMPWHVTTAPPSLSPHHDVASHHD